MARLLRTIPVLLALAAAGIAFETTALDAQAAVPAAEAQPFLGAWSISIDAEGQTFVMNLDIQDDEGNVAAEVTNEMMPGATRASRVAKSGDNLVLTFTIDAQGMVVPMVMTLKSEGEALNADVDFADGMFVTAGKATKR
jgi:invasion protein IalB